MSAELFVDIPHSSALSDLDSLSDSDWLEIASNRESDNDSLSDRHEVGSMPPSRRSSLSLGSSIDGQLDAWEGFTSDVEQDSPDLERSFDQAEELRVRDALDQSMMSTLSASRSNSYPSTVQNSLRDLRLSFPDPLTSSRDELTDSYQAITPDDGPAHTEPEETKEPESSPLNAMPLPPLVDLDVFLYGSPTALKWTIADSLLARALTFDVSPSHVADSHTRWLTVPHPQRVIAIHDRTDGSEVSEQHQPDKPSLAIVFLPSSPVFPTTHSFYFIVSDEHVLPETDIMLIPQRAGFDKPSDILHPEPRIHLNTVDARIAFSAMLKSSISVPPQAKKASGVAMEQFWSVQAATLFALVAILVGVVIKASLHGAQSLPPTPTAPIKAWDSSHNTTTSISLRSGTQLAVAPVFNYITTRQSPGSSDVASSATAQTSAQKLRASTDVILRPPNTVADVQATTCVTKPVVEPAVESTATSSLAIRLVDSLSEFVDATTKAVLVVFQNDIKELTDALDALMRAIRRQVATVLLEYKTTAQMLREEFFYRNSRAQGKARELKRKSEQLLLSAAKELKKRTMTAKKRAFTIKETIFEQTIFESPHSKRTQEAMNVKAQGPLPATRRLSHRRSAKFDRRLHGHSKEARRKRFFNVH